MDSSSYDNNNNNNNNGGNNNGGSHHSRNSLRESQTNPLPTLQEERSEELRQIANKSSHSVATLPNNNNNNNDKRRGSSSSSFHLDYTLPLKGEEHDEHENNNNNNNNNAATRASSSSSSYLQQSQQQQNKNINNATVDHPSEEEDGVEVVIEFDHVGLDNVDSNDDSSCFNNEKKPSSLPNLNRHHKRSMSFGSGFKQAISFSSPSGRNHHQEGGSASLRRALGLGLGLNLNKNSNNKKDDNEMMSPPLTESDVVNTNNDDNDTNPSISTTTPATAADAAKMFSQLHRTQSQPFSSSTYKRAQSFHSSSGLRGSSNARFSIGGGEAQRGNYQNGNIGSSSNNSHNKSNARFSIGGGEAQQGNYQYPHQPYQARPSFLRSLSITNSEASFGGGGNNSGGARGGGDHFTSNLTRKSQNYRNSIARSATALARFTRTSGTGFSENGTDGIGPWGIPSPTGVAGAGGTTVDNLKQQRRIYRGYNVGDVVLINNQGDRWATCVNRFGYCSGEGSTVEEQRGPYWYVLGKVIQVHYEENAVFYTVTREDSGENVRGDAGFMEPLLSESGIAAARRAAKKYLKGTPVDNVNEEEGGEAQNDRIKFLRVMEDFLAIVLLPVLWIYDCFVVVIGARLFRWSRRAFRKIKHHAGLFLNGMKPYECSMTITSVNLIVLCSIWYMFIDQARLAFFPASADYTLAVLNFVIWTILLVELVFEVFIRPDDYHNIIRSDKAYTPTTVRFISGLHLVIEFISLAFFVPEFLCLFQDSLTCDGRPVFSFLNATMLAVMGPRWTQALAGRAFYACVRLRVFGLVRHWKNMWINKTFLKRQKQKLILAKMQEKRAISLDKAERGFEDASSNRDVKSTRNKLLQKQRDAALINASNIGTALMVTNSYRALAILCAILGLLPMIEMIGFQSFTNPVTTSMVGQLQGTNTLVTVENQTNCEFLVDSVESWVNAWESRDRRTISSDTSAFLVALVIQPSRCVTQFIDLELAHMTFVYGSCTSIKKKFSIETMAGDDSENCVVGSLIDAEGSDLQDVAKNLGLRTGNIITEYSKNRDQSLEYEDGTDRNDVLYSVEACFNQTYSVESSAFASFVLQFCLLFTVLGGLSILRRDAEDLVLGPLRSMLRIVARYAKNPLAQASGNKDNFSVISDSESEASNYGDDFDDDSRGDGFGTYETEQLITAVAKITDLLRKCWGVAGADIISTNLASREGALAEVFNPTVPGKSVYALFAFAAINGFDHALRCLGGDVMILINDVAAVLHGEVYRWGFAESGQCNKNLGDAFLMVFRIGLVKEVVQKLEEATKVVFSTSNTKKLSAKKRPKVGRKDSMGSQSSSRALFTRNMAHNLRQKNHDKQHEAMADAMKLSLQSLPGISTFTDRAVIGMLKSFADIHRDNKLRAWSRDFRLSAGVGAFSVNMIFGMDAGWAVEGAVGSEYKIDATYLSPHVNMASRMMSACKQYGVTILLSEAVQELMSDVARTMLRNVDRVTVKGSTRIQKIFTYDARHQGADFFLFGRSAEQADMEAERYVPNIWNTDQDLKAMRHHVTDEFEEEFNLGLKAYYAGDWPLAIQRLEKANEIMVNAAWEEGYLHDELDNSPDRKELYRSETADGPSTYLIHFMKSKGGIAPEGWDGWHPLYSK